MGGWSVFTTGHGKVSEPPPHPPTLLLLHGVPVLRERSTRISLPRRAGDELRHTTDDAAPAPGYLCPLFSPHFFSARAQVLESSIAYPPSKPGSLRALSNVPSRAFRTQMSAPIRFRARFSQFSAVIAERIRRQSFNKRLERCSSVAAFSYTCVVTSCNEWIFQEESNIRIISFYIPEIYIAMINTSAIIISANYSRIFELLILR